jgi:hypothetical protein
MLRSLASAILLTILAPFGIAQSASTAKPAVKPESAFVSSEKYANAFFGFSLALPQDPHIRNLIVPSPDSSEHSLFGLQAQTNGLSALSITAIETSGDASSEDAKKVASTSDAPGVSATKMEIGGKQFWKGESLQERAGNKMRSLIYAAALNGYVVKFLVISFDPKLADELQHSIESIKFFDPAKAKEMAGPNSQPYSVTMKGLQNQF